MLTRTPFRYRVVLLAAMLLPLSLVGLALAQPGGFGPGGIPRPPIGPGGPGRFGPMGPPGGFGPMGPRGGLGPTTYEFTCSNCKKTVTTGISQFSAEHIANCPHCGVRFNNTMAGETAKRMDEMKQRMDEMAGRARGWDNRGGVPPSGPSTPVQPPPPVNKPPSQPFNRDLVDPFEPISNTSPTSGPPVKSNRGTTIVLIIFVVGGLVLLLMVAGIGGLVWMITTAPKTHGSGGTRRRPRRPNNYEAV